VVGRTRPVVGLFLVYGRSRGVVRTMLVMVRSRLMIRFRLVIRFWFVIWFWFVIRFWIVIRFWFMVWLGHWIVRFIVIFRSIVNGMNGLLVSVMTRLQMIFWLMRFHDRIMRCVMQLWSDKVLVVGLVLGFVTGNRVVRCVVQLWIVWRRSMSGVLITVTVVPWLVQRWPW
jgi:hypothetical protein